MPWSPSFHQLYSGMPRRGMAGAWSIIWLIFSSRVILLTRSLTRSATGSEGSRNLSAPWARAWPRRQKLPAAKRSAARKTATVPAGEVDCFDLMVWGCSAKVWKAHAIVPERGGRYRAEWARGLNIGRPCAYRQARAVGLPGGSRGTHSGLHAQPGDSGFFIAAASASGVAGKAGPARRRTRDDSGVSSSRCTVGKLLSRISCSFLGQGLLFEGGSCPDTICR